MKDTSARGMRMRSAYAAGILLIILASSVTFSKAKAVYRGPPPEDLCTIATKATRIPVRNPPYIAPESEHKAIIGPSTLRENITLCPWAARPAIAPYLHEVDRRDPSHEASQLMVQIFAEFERQYGVVPLARGGTLLGSYRDQRMPSCDGDMDLWLLVPPSLGREKAVEGLRKVVDQHRATTGANVTFSSWALLRWLYYDSRFGPARVVLHYPDGSYFKADVDLVETSLLDDPELRNEYAVRCKVPFTQWLKRLCRCRYYGTTTLACIADAKDLLSASYGNDFLTPSIGSYNELCTFQMHFPNTFLRTRPMKALRTWLQLHPAFDLDDSS